MADYRIRFTPRSPLSGDEPITAHPGIIRRNKPRALRVLSGYQRDQSTTYWLESRTSEHADWKRAEP
jgi:hypothetical protein